MRREGRPSARWTARAIVALALVAAPLVSCDLRESGVQRPSVDEDRTPAAPAPDTDTGPDAASAAPPPEAPAEAPPADTPPADEPAEPEGPMEFTYVDLVERLTSMEELAVLPPEGEKGAQCSSYDRASRYDEATGKYLGWDANGDGGGIIRREGDKVVMAEMEGPGCIWRIWSAAVGDGHVRIYLDGSEEPAVDLAFKGYFDGANPPFTYRSLVHRTAAGLNNYVPIPYARSCKVTADEGWGNYYQFVYTKFPEGTVVPTFRRELTDDEFAALGKADRMLSNCGRDPAGRRPGEATTGMTKVEIAPGGSATLAKLNGPRAVTALKVKIDPDAYDDIKKVLRNTILRIRWDGEASSSVWTPLGDFFGTAYGPNRYRSLPLGITEDGMYSYWYMPFAKSALVEVLNEDEVPVELECEIVHAPLSRPVAKLGRFHAKWHRNAFLPEEKERWIDWTLLKTTGRGRYCGVMLHVWNPRGGWWGEGDEKFHVDGEKFPSTIGTGSEDYFGYAWCNPELFQNAYHNQTISMGNRGHISVNRWHIADNVPFLKSFEGYIEKYWADKRPTRYASIAYWYLDPDGEDPYGPEADRVAYYATFARASVKGVVEGEDLEILETNGGGAGYQEMGGFGDGWSGDAQLWWTNGKPGSRLTVGLPVAEAKRYDVRVQLTKAIDYGIVRMSLDGKPVGDEVDLFNDGVIPTGEFSLGVHDLTKGRHKLAFEITGANDRAKKAYMVGIDYVKLVPAE